MRNLLKILLFAFSFALFSVPLPARANENKVEKQKVATTDMAEGLTVVTLDAVFIPIANEVLCSLPTISFKTTFCKKTNVLPCKTGGSGAYQSNAPPRYKRAQGVGKNQ